MFKIGHMGRFETLPAIAEAIWENDLPVVEQAIKEGLALEEPLVLSRYISMTPLDIALTLNKPDMVRLLVEHGAELNAKDRPAMLQAARFCGEDVIRYLHEKGAKLQGRSKVKSTAYDEAYYGNKKNIPLFYELGLDIRKHAGKTLRTAVSDHDMQTVRYLLDHGVDINYNEPDMVYPYKATPLTVAARNNNLNMVRFLVEQGADVTIQEKDGERAYTIAVSQNNREMAEYLKAHEPEEFHSVSNKLHALKAYKLPQSLIDFLMDHPGRVELPTNDSGVGYIEFFHLVDTVEMKLGRKKLLRISSQVDQYSHIAIVWNPGVKRIGYVDLEHQEQGDVAAWNDFLADPGQELARFIDAM